MLGLVTQEIVNQSVEIIFLSCRAKLSPFEMSTSQNYFLYGFLNQHTFPYLQSSDNNLALLIWPENVLPENFSPATPMRPWFHPWSWVVLNPPGWKTSVAKMRAVLPFEYITVCIADFHRSISSWPWKTSGILKLFIFALLRIFKPCCWKFSVVPEKEPIEGSVVGQKGYSQAGVSSVISHMTSGHVFSFELPLTTISCKPVKYMKNWAVLCCHGDVV